MSLSEIAIRYRTIVLTLVVMLMGWGVVAYLTMPRRENPEFTIRSCMVTTVWPGVPAVKVEQLVTDKLEEQLERIESVKTLKSTTTTGLSSISVELEDECDDIQNVWNQVRAKVALAQMPDPNIRPIVNDNFGDTTIFLMAVHQVPLADHDAIREQDRYSPRQLEKYADLVRDALRILPGVSAVYKYGVKKEAVYVETDLANWSQLGLTTSQLKNLVQDRNAIAQGGEINTPAGRYSVKPGSDFNTVDQLRSIIVDSVESGGSGNPVYLTDLGLNVRRGYKDPATYYCRVNTPKLSTTAVMLGLQMKSGQNIVDVCDRAKDRIERLLHVERTLPPDVKITLISDQSIGVTAKISEVMVNVIEAVLIVVGVVFVFVGFRSAIVMAVNIPIIVLASLGIISVLGVQLEQISLASIIISLGLLVDNAVQVCDQSRTNQMKGMDPITATIKGTETLKIPMLVGTLTTMAAFIPMMFALKGGSAEFIYSLPVTLSVTLGLSWILVMTLCVLLAVWFIRPPKTPDTPASPMAWVMNRLSPPKKNGGNDDNIILRGYGAFAAMCIRAKWLTLAVAIGMFFWAVQLPVPSENFPTDLRDQFAVLVQLPETATIEQANEKAKQVEEIIRKLSLVADANGQPIERLTSMRTLVGGGGSRWNLAWSPEPQQPNYAEILIHTSDGRFTPDYADDIRRVAERGDVKLGIEPISGARVVPKQLGLGPPSDPLVFRVIGDGFADMKQLHHVANKIKRIVHEQPETWNVHDSWGVDGYQLHIEPDEDKANLAGVNNLQIADTLSAYFSGLQLTTFREGDYQIPVYFRLNPEDRVSIDELQTAFVEGQEGKVPLEAIATIESRWDPARIERRDRSRVIEVRASMEPGAAGNDVTTRIFNSKQVQEIIATLPASYRIELGGSVEDSAESTSQMLTSFGISILLIMLCLVFQYNGLAKPLIILTTLPMALIGALPGLYFTGSLMGFMPQLGILSLFGIVLNTGVIFIEFVDILILKKWEEKSAAGTLDGPIIGLTREEFRQCLVESGKVRMLPIFLTTATTMGGLFPLALAGGPLWTGLAWTMIFGLAVATLLTLLVIPAIYAILVETFGLKPIVVEE